MADLRDQTVVVFRGNHVGDCSDRLPDLLQLFDSAIRGGFNRTEEKRGIAKQVDVCRFRTRMFLACHGMPANERNPKAFGLAANCKLCAADIDNQGVLRGKLIEQF